MLIYKNILSIPVFFRISKYLFWAKIQYRKENKCDCGGVYSSKISTWNDKKLIRNLAKGSSFIMATNNIPMNVIVANEFLSKVDLTISEIFLRNDCGAAHVLVILKPKFMRDYSSISAVDCSFLLRKIHRKCPWWKLSW